MRPQTPTSATREDVEQSSVLDPRLDGLMRIAQAAETAATLEQLLYRSLIELNRLFQSDRAFVLLVDASGRMTLACEHPSPGDAPALTLDSLAGAIDVIRMRRPVVIETEKAREGWDIALLRARGVQTMIVTPLIACDEALGVLAVCSANAARVFGSEEVAFIRTLSGQMALAIASFRSRDAAERRTQELKTLNEIAATVTSTLDTHEVYRLVVQQLSDYFHVEAGSLLLLDESTGDLEFVMTIEGGEEKLAGIRVPAGQGVVGHVVRTGRWEIVHDVTRDPRFYSKISETTGFPTRSILCVPMIARGRVIGAIELLNKIGGDFDEEEAQRLMRMAAFIAVAIENARLFQQIAAGRDRMASILNSTADGILMADMRGDIQLANPLAARICACTEEALIGRRIDDVVTELQARAHEVSAPAWGQDASAPVQIRDLALTDGMHRYVRLLRLPVYDAHNEPHGELLILRDITQERELEQLREDYTSMLVHDLRAPLTSIMNGIMMLQRGIVGPVNEQQQELLKIAYQGSQTMLHLINTLLDISKLEQGQMTLDLKPLPIFSVIDQAIERLHNLASSRHVTIEQRLAPYLPPVEIDGEKIVRVLQNLLDNAIKFSPPQSVVTIGAFLAGSTSPLPEDAPVHLSIEGEDYLVVWVQDRGPGIPPAYFQRIFEKFGQVRGRKVRGTGLGLTFCRLAVEAHGGRIWVESVEGSGSVFAFTLPVRRDS
ncbi:sensor histidine kinase [Roseiflexus castenholzii]|uniref:histidine kinase n=1 Tax=Roseiflexus castenholzii (strain DSM 13941 / HLO8) TaxID=383372 RepID=A7NPH4_ROSCS|nr:GAF domain-containing protein [Roseiflexus castenholzii]ABU59470.1 multi-sensor signal transduction histidine kinase [Roseiflexus castenholzii DSM 13941]